MGDSNWRFTVSVLENKKINEEWLNIVSTTN